MNPHSTPDAAEAAKHEVLRCTVGSKVLGLNLPGTDDLDLMGICVEPPEYVVGLRRFEQWISRTRADGTPTPEGARSEPGDTDLTVYSARKWCSLALGGNPSVILPLFVPPSETQVITKHGKALRDMSDAFLSKSSGRAFLGYMVQQRERMVGIRGGKHTNRPELIEMYGYDVKYAYHLLRLGFQGCEFMETGRITLPMPVGMRGYLLDVRQGKVSMDDVLDAAGAYEGMLEAKLAAASIPARGDAARVERWLLETYAEVWSVR